MKKLVFALCTALGLWGAVQPGYADGGRGGGHDFHGGGHDFHGGGRNFHGGGRDFHGRFDRSFHGFRDRDDDHARVFLGFGVGPFFYPDPWYYGPAPVIVTPPPSPPPAYVQQQPYYWYYCPDPRGYYPYIKTCPSGWLQVVPQTPSP